MKQIKITTFVKARNYGAALQAFALQNVLEQNKEQVYFINYKDRKIEEGYRIFYIDKKSLNSILKSILSNIIFFTKNIRKRHRFNSFINKKIKLTNSIKKIDDIQQKINADIFITGSDQVWNPEITGELSDIYTLNFGNKNIKRISYAASVGNEKNIQKYKEDYIKKISKIDKISVREESAKIELERILPDKEIEVVLDPTLLLTKEEWKKEISDLKNEKEKYILAYHVKEDKEFIKITNELSRKTGYKIIHFDKRNRGLKNVLRSAYIEGPLEFINLIKNAEYIVATSFHATVFSIIFNKKFWIVPHATTGSRVTDLLKKLGISNRAVKNFEEFKKKDYNEEIDYEKVNKKLEEERKKSLEWLNDAIEK